MKTIPQFRFKAQNKPVEVSALYPDVQIDRFEYFEPFREGGSSEKPDQILIIASTIHNKKLYFTAHEINDHMMTITLNESAVEHMLKHHLYGLICDHVYIYAEGIYEWHNDKY
jgi:hypothetical protein